MFDPLSSLRFFVRMRQFDFDFTVFLMNFSSGFLNGFSSPFIVHSRSSFLFSQ